MTGSSVKDDPLVIPPIEPGEYQLLYRRHEKYPLRSQLKLAIHFEIVQAGEYQGRSVARHYRVLEAGQRWKAPFRVDRHREWLVRSVRHECRVTSRRGL